MLDIVFRSCEKNVVHPERGERFIETDKTTLIKKCFRSLVDSIVFAKDIDIRLWILDDHSTEELLLFFKKLCEENKIIYHIENLKVQGYNYSAYKQFEFCKDKGRDWVYCVEDDYLHFPEAIFEMYQQANKFRESFKQLVAIRPDDDVFTYSLNTSYANKPYRILMGLNRHWRTLHTCHNTVFTNVSVFENYWEIFASLAKFFKRTRINEDGTINVLWNDGASADGPVILLSPIPTLAIHISQNNEPPFVNWKKLWNELGD